MSDSGLIHGVRHEGPGCLRCGGPTDKVIHYGLPGWFCVSEECSTAGGLGFDVPELLRLPFTGWVTYYEGPFWPALWRWLQGDCDDE